MGLQLRDDISSNKCCLIKQAAICKDQKGSTEIILKVQKVSCVSGGCLQYKVGKADGLFRQRNLQELVKAK